MKKLIVLVFAALFVLGCVMPNSFDSTNKSVSEDPVIEPQSPVDPDVPQAPLVPTLEPDGGTTQIFYFTDKFLGHNDDPNYIPTIAYTWEYYNNPDEQHIYLFKVFDYDASTQAIGAERFRIPYPGVQFTGNEGKIYGNGINIGGHNFIGGYMPTVEKFGRKIESIMIGKTGPWMDIGCGWVDASKFEWVPEAVKTSIFYGEPYPQVYGADFLFNFSDPENPFLEEVVISYDALDNLQ